jgi:hypothetical protein
MLEDSELETTSLLDTDDEDSLLLTTTITEEVELAKEELITEDSTELADDTTAILDELTATEF